MKKLVLIFLITVFFGACGGDSYYYHIATNHSLNETVVVNFHRNSDAVTLLPGESKEIAFLIKGDGERGIENYSPEKRVYVNYVQSSGKCHFYDRQSYEVKILNLSGKSGILDADGWTNIINFSNIDTEQTNSLWLLYRVNPNFSASTDDGYPLNVIFIKDGETFKVTINP
ncbi:MAG: hypothetical protein FWD22_02355 [Treponema sp.]|nr:hypothetical protein [Treponema sp.]